MGSNKYEFFKDMFPNICNFSGKFIGDNSIKSYF
jgi:hypothetical protein